MGTLSTRHDHHLEVKDEDGKRSTFTLDEKTRIRRGKAAVAVGELKPGDRVVVTATETKDKDGKPMLLATEIRLGSANTTPLK
jgi:hypothetical protein